MLASYNRRDESDYKGLGITIKELKELEVSMRILYGHRINVDVVFHQFGITSDYLEGVYPGNS